MVLSAARALSGWLLRCNRMLGPQQEFRSARRFVAALGRRIGQNVAASQPTRWETGETLAPADVIVCYEKLLGLRAYSLTVVIDAVSRFTNSGGARAGRVRDTDDARLHELLERAVQAGAMSSSTWLELTACVRGRPHLVLHPPRLWDAVVENLLSELVIAEDTGWLVRQEAMCRLLEHPAAAPRAVGVCVAMVRDPAIPVYLEPASLLDAADIAAANRFVWTQVVRPDSPAMLQGALLAAVGKSRRGHFRPDDKSAMLRSVVELLSSTTVDPTLALPAAELAGHLWGQCAGSLPPRSVRPFPGSGAEIWLPRQRTAPAGVDALCAGITLRAQAHLDIEPTGPDERFVELVRSMLFSSNLDERLYAGMLLAATPYRQPLIDALLEELTTGLLRRHASVALSVFQALNTLNSTEHHAIVCRLLLDGSTGTHLRMAASRSMPHHAGHVPASVWSRIHHCQLDHYVRQPSPEQAAVLHSIAYGIAADGHHQLATEICGDLRVPASVRATARWWNGIPSAVRAAAVA